MQFFQIVLNQILLFIIYAGIGIIAVKTKLLNEAGLNSISRLIMRIIIPIMIFTNTINGATRADLFSYLIVIPLTFLMYGMLYLVALLLAKLFRMRGNTGRVFRAGTIFGNIGFIGIPLVAALFPERGMIYVALFTIADQWIVWTVGWGLSAPEAKEKQKFSFRDLIRKIINPSTVSIVLAILFVLTGVHLPSLLNKAFVNVSSINSVLAMIYLGGIFCFLDVSAYIKKIEIYGAILAKMLLVPVAFYAFLGLFPVISAEIRITMVIISALPVMTIMPMFARNQGSDGDYSAGMLFVTTVASIVTLPMICLLIG